MEKFLNPCDMEYMKMAMLKHEEMFREQVYELHRLYEIQKMFMKNISSSRGNRQNQDKWTKSKKENSFHKDSNDDMHQQPGQKLDLEQPADQENTAELDEGEIELTLGPSSYCQRRKIDETPLTSDSGLGFSSSSGGSGGRIKRTNSGIHRINDRRKEEEVIAQNWGLVEVPNSNPSFLNGRSSNSDIKEQVRQDRVQQPPWLFQVLSMNIT